MIRDSEGDWRRGPSEAIVRALLDRVSMGELTIRLPNGGSTTYRGAEPGPSAEITLRSRKAARRVLTQGPVGFAEGYMEGDWDTPDLAAVLEFAHSNAQRARAAVIPAPALPLQRALHRLRSNTRRGSRRNISYHYDLGNDFYELWLDDTLTYSCGLFGQDAEGHPPDASLECAQRRKWDRLLDLLQPSRGDRLLEIGCGWGGFALHAARETGCRVTGITVSEEQLRLASARVEKAGLDGLVDIRLQDYRDVREEFSGIVSIEMFEAVGEKYWPVFFNRVSELLLAGGRAAIQTITIDESQFDKYRRSPDFIQRYIFPGGMLPSPERFKQSAAAAGLRAVEPHFFGLSYAKTLELWHERFDAAHDDIARMGFDERFMRMWRYYLAYCRTGFMSGNIDVMQVSLEPATR